MVLKRAWVMGSSALPEAHLARSEQRGPHEHGPVAEGLGVSWNTANVAALAEGKRVLIDDPTRFDDVKRQ